MKGCLKKNSEEWKKTLFERRSARVRPFKDETVLTAWNGLMIDVLAQASTAFNQPRYLEAAMKAALFLKNNMWNGSTLLRRYIAKDVKFSATLEDYAYLIKGLLSLFERGAGGEFLEWAITLTKIAEKEFKEIEGAFYQTDGKDPLILRKCDFYDGAEPSGNGVHAENLIRLYQLTWEEGYLRQAEDILKAAKGYIDVFAPAASYNLMALQRYLDNGAPTVVIALNDKKSGKEEILNALGSCFCPMQRFFGRKISSYMQIKSLSTKKQRYISVKEVSVFHP
ncbi:MAG: hypothetical protein LVR00_01760 [Rhabdochlamydiaceae bacterium]|jgi:uncharacterized protein YyaL (SSP411 family)